MDMENAEDGAAEQKVQRKVKEEVQGRTEDIVNTSLKHWQCLLKTVSQHITFLGNLMQEMNVFTYFHVIAPIYS